MRWPNAQGDSEVDRNPLNALNTSEVVEAADDEWATMVAVLVRPNDDAESRVQQRGRPNRRASHLLNTCEVGLSYVHDDLHNHNIVFKNIYISGLAHVLMHARPPATRKPVGRPLSEG